MSKGFITGTNEELIKAYKESRDESYLKELIEANKGLTILSLTQSVTLSAPISSMIRSLQVFIILSTSSNSGSLLS